jgi:hypothetical protein
MYPAVEETFVARVYIGATACVNSSRKMNRNDSEVTVTHLLAERHGQALIGGLGEK